MKTKAKILDELEPRWEDARIKEIFNEPCVTDRPNDLDEFQRAVVEGWMGRESFEFKNAPLCLLELAWHCAACGLALSEVAEEALERMRCEP